MVNDKFKYEVAIKNIEDFVKKVSNKKIKEKDKTAITIKFLKNVLGNGFNEGVIFIIGPYLKKILFNNDLSIITNENPYVNNILLNTDLEDLTTNNNRYICLYSHDLNTFEFHFKDNKYMNMIHIGSRDLEITVPFNLDNYVKLEYKNIEESLAFEDNGLLRSRYDIEKYRFYTSNSASISNNIVYDYEKGTKLIESNAEYDYNTVNKERTWEELDEIDLTDMSPLIYIVKKEEYDWRNNCLDSLPKLKNAIDTCNENLESNYSRVLKKQNISN